MNKITIVVPVYLSEDYLSVTINSVLHQTIDNWELILVDDGSPDNSKSVCKVYTDKDERIKYIYQENQGPAYAMLKGLKCSSGDFIMFLDGDDWIEERTLELAMDAQERNDADIVFWDRINEFENHSAFAKPLNGESKLFLKEELFVLQRRVFGLIGKELRNGISNFDRLSSGWGKLYRKEVLLMDKYALVNREGYNNFDTELTCRVFINALKIYYLHEYLNHYRRYNTNSVTKNYENSYFKRQKVTYQSLLLLCETRGLDYDFKQAIYNRITVSVLNSLLTITMHSNTTSLVSKYNTLKEILKDELYQESIKNFEFNHLSKLGFLFFKLVEAKKVLIVLIVGYLVSFVRLLKMTYVKS